MTSMKKPSATVRLYAGDIDLISRRSKLRKESFADYVHYLLELDDNPALYGISGKHTVLEDLDSMIALQERKKKILEGRDSDGG